MINKKVITIRELKNLIKDLPEVDAENGEEFEVWINGTSCKYGLSNPCSSVIKLNKGDYFLRSSSIENISSNRLETKNLKLNINVKQK
jgi:hypothetical protein